VNEPDGDSDADSDGDADGDPDGDGDGDGDADAEGGSDLGEACSMNSGWEGICYEASTEGDPLHAEQVIGFARNR